MVIFITNDYLGLDHYLNTHNRFFPVSAFVPDTDLHAVIKKGTLLKDIHKRYVMYQLLKATKYLHSGTVIHRDQKVQQMEQM